VNHSSFFLIICDLSAVSSALISEFGALEIFLKNNATKSNLGRLAGLSSRDALGAKVELTGEFSTSALRCDRHLSGLCGASCRPVIELVSPHNNA